ncbi:hypothetical protein EJ110_NYTH05366 [Nymphaea thermarum]|nr:hypothetical protein EJ110_NYTH05366 [Nymphaea thermarum]
MARVYKLFGWEYRKPERPPPACPYRPSSQATGGITNPHPAQIHKLEDLVDVKDLKPI